LSALVAFLVGWAGAILCMAQKWYIGPIAKLVGEFGADVCCPFIFKCHQVPFALIITSFSPPPPVTFAISLNLRA